MEKEESSQNSIDEQQQQQQQQQQYTHHHKRHHHEENDQDCHRRQEEVRDKFVFIEFRAENLRRFRNYKLLGREATFAICPPSTGTDIARWIESAG